MGLFDVGSFRVRKSSALRDGATYTDAASLQRKNDERLAANLGLLYDARHSVSSHSLSNSPHPTPLPNRATLQTQKSVSSLSGRNAARQSKLERMMGAGVPEVQVVSHQDRRAPQAFAHAPPAPTSNPPSPDRARHHKSHLGRQHSLSERSDSHSYSRPQTSAQPSLGASTTFTEMTEVECPVCLEPLSHRLAGEKPHVVPSCGHALHNACFTAIYGPPDLLLAAQNSGNNRLRSAGSSSRANPGPPGMCGVCRRPIVLGADSHASKSHKLAGIPLEESHGSNSVNAGLDSVGNSSVLEAHTDDPLDIGASSKSRVLSSSASFSSSSSSLGNTIPTLRAKPEFPTVYCRPGETGHPAKLNVVSVMTIDVPSRRSPPLGLYGNHLATISDEYTETEYGQERREEEDSYSDDLKRSGSGMDAATGTATNTATTPLAPGAAESSLHSPDEVQSLQEPTNKAEERALAGSPEEPGFSFGATPAGLPSPDANEGVLEDLQQRVTDWKGHSIQHFGPLILHDLLNIRQDSVVREFHVYLFQDALLCVTEEKKKGLGRFIPNTQAGAAGVETSLPTKPALKLKGRIYLRHIRRVLDSSASGEHSISITMDDMNFDQFVLCFRDIATMSIWTSRLKQLVELNEINAGASSPTATNDGRTNPVDVAPATAANSPTTKREEPAADVSQDAEVHATGVAVSAAGLVGRASGSAPVVSGTASVLSGKSGSHSSALLSQQQQWHPRRLSGVSVQLSQSGSANRSSLISDTVPAYQQWSPSGGLDPRLPPPNLLPHTPLDLVLMISIPTVLPEHFSGSISSSAALKLRLIRSTLDFIIHTLGPKDRVSLVAFTVGFEGVVKRTGLLSPQRESSREILHCFIENIGRPWEGDQLDPFRVDLSKLGGSSDRIDSVTAVNVGLDVVLGRKAKNGVTGMMLINDTSDGPKRNQMDLVLARAEAANVAIHCFGYGKTHDPSSLWLISNHTKGSYTFVREWYQLRECLSGCIGSMMSVALTDVKIHVAVPQDNQFRIRKVAGWTGAVISSSGKDVDIDIGELRFGEAKDLLIELELDVHALLPTLKERRADSQSVGLGSIEQGSATDDFMQRMGIQDLSLADSDEADGYLEQMVEEIGIFEAEVSFKDPAVGTTTSRLPSPTVLTLEIDTHSSDPLSNGPPGLAAVVAEPTVTRRRLEVLVSDMITRSLLLISRKNYGQALKVITETRRIIDTVVQALNGPGQSKRKSIIAYRSNQRKQREAANQRTIFSLLAMMGDLDLLSEGLENQNRSTFDRDGRNFGAQQAMILRDQKAWTTRSDTEYLNFRDDNAAAFTAWSASFASSR